MIINYEKKQITVDIPPPNSGELCTGSCNGFCPFYHDHEEHEELCIVDLADSSGEWMKPGPRCPQYPIRKAYINYLEPDIIFMLSAFPEVDEKLFRDTLTYVEYNIKQGNYFVILPSKFCGQIIVDYVSLFIKETEWLDGFCAEG